MSKIIKILINKRDYTDYQFIEPETNNSLKNEDYNFIDPIKDKLFTRDYLSITDNKFTLDHSYVRESGKMAGVLILQDNKTYGRNKTGKRIYSLSYWSRWMALKLDTKKIDKKFYKKLEEEKKLRKEFRKKFYN